MDIPKTRYRVPFNGKFSWGDLPTKPPKDAPTKKACRKELSEVVDSLKEMQRMLYAQDKLSLLLVFQAMDAAGKDGTIRAIFSGVNPAGFQVFSFKQPSATDLDHDFLWRTSKCLPERGRIGVFNRSYYEEVLVVRVHPEYLDNQRIAKPKHLDALWKSRFESIREHEKHLAENGTVIVKFWLNVSYEEQRERFLSRLNEPEKHWKFSESDVRERGYWKQYMHAYEQMLKETSRKHAPWYAIPADNKPYMRLQVARTVLAQMQKMGLHYPKVDKEVRSRFDHYRDVLNREV